MNTHCLKIWPNHLQDILLGLKKVDIRKNDRDFKEGDLYIFKNGPLKKEYTGLVITMKISYIIGGVPGLEPGYVILQISKPL